MARERTVTEKVADWATAFNAISAELTPAPLRTMMAELTSAVPPQGADDMEQVAAYIARVNAASGVSGLVFRNDRAAAIAAAMLTQSGVSRPVITQDGETE